MKKLLNRKQKGFTIVELVIVIAVIGILAGVLIPVFINLNNKANKAADEALVKNLNTALATQEQEPGDTKNNTLNDAVEDLKSYGYLLPNLVAKSDEDLLWNQKTNRFLLAKEAPESNEYKLVDYWRIQNDLTNDKGYSIYAGTNFNLTNVTVAGVGFDAGDHTEIETVTYNGNSNVNNVVVRTNGGTLTINAKNDTVHHYGEGLVLNIQAIAGASYHENGYFPKASIAKGRIVVEEKGQIQVLDASGATAAVTIEKQGNGKITNVVKGENSNVTVEEDLTPNIATMTTVSTWAALKTEVETGTNKVINYEPTADQTGVATISIGRSVTIFGNGTNATGALNPESVVATPATRRHALFEMSAPNISVMIDKVNIYNTGTGAGINLNIEATGSELIYTNSHMNCKQYAICTDVCSDRQNLTLKNISFAANCFNCVYWRSNNSNFTADNCDFVSTNASGGTSNDFSTVCISEPHFKDREGDSSVRTNKAENNTIKISNSTFVQNELSTSRQQPLSIYSPYNNKVYFENVKYTGAILVIKASATNSSWNNSLKSYTSDSISYEYPTNNSQFYLDGKLADNSLNVLQCVAVVNSNYGSGFSAPRLSGTTTVNPGTLNDDTAPYYGYELVNNGDGTWTYRKK